MLCQYLVHASAEAQDLPRVNIDVRRLAGEPTHRRLMNQNPRIRQGEPFSWRTGGEKQSTHAGRLPDADGRHVRTDELHRIVDSHPGRNGPAGGIYVERDILVRILRLQKQQLRRDQVRHVVVDRSPQKDDAVFEQT